MFSRAVLRRAARIPQAARRNVRFASDTAAPGQPGPALTGSIAGGVSALVVVYGFYQFSGAKKAVQTAREAQSYIESAKNTLKVQLDEKVPDTNQAIEQLKQTALQYAAWIPGGRGYVESAFKDLDAIREKHGGEVEQIVSEAYEELRDTSKKGFNLETANETYNVLTKHLERLASLAGDASEQILNNHPELKEKLGGSADQLKQLGQRLGPEAKKEIDETWNQVREILQSGLSVTSLGKVRQLVQDKQEKLRQLADKAFNQGFEQLKPMLDKNPQVKKIVEENMDTLKQGNISEGISKVRSALSSGSTEQLEQYFEQAKSKANQYSGGQLSSWLSSVPSGSEIIPQLQKVQEIAQKHGPEAEKLVKDIASEMKQVLDRKKDDIQNLYEKSKQDAQK